MPDVRIDRRRNAVLNALVNHRSSSSRSEKRTSDNANFNPGYYGNGRRIAPPMLPVRCARKWVVFVSQCEPAKRDRPLSGAGRQVSGSGGCALCGGRLGVAARCDDIAFFKAGFAGARAALQRESIVTCGRRPSRFYQAAWRMRRVTSAACVLGSKNRWTVACQPAVARELPAATQTLRSGKP